MSKRNSSSIFGVIVIVVGLYFLALNLGLPFVMDFDFGDLVSLLWPLLLVSWGLDALAKRNYVLGAILSILGVNFMVDSLSEYLPFLSPLTSLIWPATIILFGLYIMVAPPKVVTASEQSFKAKRSSKASTKEGKSKIEVRVQPQVQSSEKSQTQVEAQPQQPQSEERLFSQKTIDSQVLIDPYTNQPVGKTIASKDQSVAEPVAPVIRTVSLAKQPEPISTTVSLPQNESMPVSTPQSEGKPVTMSLEIEKTDADSALPKQESAEDPALPKQVAPPKPPHPPTAPDHVIHIKSTPEFSSDTDFTPPKMPKSHTRMYQTTFNSKKLTFTDSDFKDGLNTIDLSCLFGEVVLLIPPTMDVTLNGSVTLGDLNFLGHKYYGVSTVTDHYQSPRTTGKTLVLNVSVILGDVKIKTL